eukprot:CAMPEP_0169474830 /NCGR_PEP_ID=MMETSP1042-20121227/26472_1 /TAXON_ID=464988 /ORGANISM="Hemiselmis andersenii, Strain CCMP1180" /LENGTH=55 /DNA_ID=CAMNT_0009588899 /DNA_START=239 /DNA_END=402 /DNA_ORIENTATION=+
MENNDACSTVDGRVENWAPATSSTTSDPSPTLQSPGAAVCPLTTSLKGLSSPAAG